MGRYENWNIGVEERRGVNSNEGIDDGAQSEILGSNTCRFESYSTH